MPQMSFAERMILVQLKYDFELVDMGEETVAVPVGESAKELKGILKLNAEGAEIFGLLQKDMDAGQIADALAARYENDRSQLLAYVNAFIQRLENADMTETN